jgi:CheY-like chemotaxis protein
MNNSIIPAWQYPSTTVFLDDNKSFLKNIQLILNDEKMVTIFVDSPSKANIFLEKSIEANQKRSQIVSACVEEAGYKNKNIHISAVHERVYDPDRFQEISLVVVDYAMPEMNGLQFASALRKKNNQIKILMLTGEADQSKAINAFNEGVIDKFMRKDEIDLLDKINEAIEVLQAVYFQQASRDIYSEDNKILPSLKDGVFIKMFQEICEKNNIVEYYLLDTEGSFLLLNRDASPLILSVKSERGMKDAYQVAFGASEEIPADILSSMKKKESIISSFKDILYDEPTELQKALRPAKKLIGDKAIYYYSLNTLPDPFALDSKKILSYRSFKDNLIHTLEM